MKFTKHLNISYLRLTGINYFIIFNYYGNNANLIFLKCNEPLFRFNKKKDVSLEVIKTIFVENINNSTSIESLIYEVIPNNKLNIILIPILFDYSIYKVKLSLDIEDYDIWFADNKSKYLPDNIDKNEYDTSYYKYSSDDSYNYFYIAAYKSIKASKIFEFSHRINVIGLFPLFTFYLDYIGNEKSISVILNSFNNRIYYLAIGNNLGIYNNSFINFNNNEETDFLGNFEQIKQKLKELVGTDQIFEYKVYLNHKSNNSFNNQYNIHYLDLKDYANDVCNYFIKRNEWDINFLPLEVLSKSFERLSRAITMKIIIVLGLILFTIQMIILSLNYYVNKNYEASIEQAQMETLNLLLDKLMTDNEILYNKMLKYNNIKNHTVKYYLLLSELSRLLENQNEVITAFEISKETDKVTIFKINGITNSNESLSIFLNKLENNIYFNEVKLLSSKQNNNNLLKNHKIEFEMVGKYVNKH